MTVAESDRDPVDRCPRCRERAPLDTLSRASRGAEDEGTMICAGCGTEEAFEQLAGRGETDADVERRSVEWTHRWIVGGHSAWRRCGSQGKDRRLVYIAPVVKGPDDKALVVKTDVRMWVR